jgi:hypothetical protein
VKARGRAAFAEKKSFEGDTIFQAVAVNPGQSLRELPLSDPGYHG